MNERLSKGEVTKDAVQHTLSAGAETVVSVTSIVAGAVRDVVNTVGDFATEVFEIREAARRARRQGGVDQPHRVDEG